MTKGRVACTAVLGPRDVVSFPLDSRPRVERGVKAPRMHSLITGSACGRPTLAAEAPLSSQFRVVEEVLDGSDFPSRVRDRSAGPGSLLRGIEYCSGGKDRGDNQKAGRVPQLLVIGW